LLEHKTLARADQLKGKFRSFLLGSLQNYLSTEADRARCLKRGGGVEFVALDQQDAEDRYKLEPVDALTPMGITFKAFDTVLGIEVALKVIETRIAANPEARDPSNRGGSTVGAEESEIEASFCEAIRIAREQQSVSLLKRAEGT
jgi:RNA polymerase sigma-70 factor (ECF subfamily)